MTTIRLLKFPLQKENTHITPHTTLKSKTISYPGASSPRISAVAGIHRRLQIRCEAQLEDGS